MLSNRDIHSLTEDFLAAAIDDHCHSVNEALALEGPSDYTRLVLDDWDQQTAGCVNREDVEARLRDIVRELPEHLFDHWTLERLGYDMYLSAAGHGTGLWDHTGEAGRYGVVADEIVRKHISDVALNVTVHSPFTFTLDMGGNK